MKSRNLIFGLAVIAMGFVSCKSETETKAEKTVDTYVVYVDSLGNIASADAKANWAAIEAEYQARTSEAEAAIAEMKDKTAAEERLAASRTRYEELKAKIQAEIAAEATPVAGAATGKGIRTTLFPGGAVGDDMAFAWVNKNNIREVYENFVETVQDNKDTYSREDWDEIKLLYEALDTRKNTVEKEGLAGEDNRKIAAAKLKFAPMYTTNRMGAKSAENQDAKGN